MKPGRTTLIAGLLFLALSCWLFDRAMRADQAQLCARGEMPLEEC